MRHQKILLVGCSGSGKSTLARQLGEVLGLPVVHLDRLYWREGWQPVAEEEFDRLLAAELEKPAWIIDGNYRRTLDWRHSCCDAVILLEYPRRVCLAGVLRRVLRGWGKTRPDMGPGCPERLDVSFLRWVWRFPKEEAEKTRQILARHPEKPCYCLRRRAEADALVKQLAAGQERME